jgi:mono/diheme cytochrome c family protein
MAEAKRRRFGGRAIAPLLIALALGCASSPPPVPAVRCPLPGARPAPPQVVVAPAGDAARGARLFRAECEGCHAGTAALRREASALAPRLDCPSWLAGVSDAYLYYSINRGPGRYGHGDGPPLGERLAPKDVADLVAYLRSLASPSAASRSSSSGIRS